MACSPVISETTAVALLGAAAGRVAAAARPARSEAPTVACMPRDSSLFGFAAVWPRGERRYQIMAITAMMMPAQSTTLSSIRSSPMRRSDRVRESIEA